MVGRFDGGRLTSDGGGILLREVDRRLGMMDRIAGCFADSRERVRAISAALGMSAGDYYTQGRRSWLRLAEKGGKHHVVPAHHVLQDYLDGYLSAARAASGAPLFRAALPGRSGLSERALSRHGALAMIKRRARRANLPAQISPHSFRGTGITEYLRNGGDLETAARIAGHESTRTTQLYNRTADQLTLDEIERVRI